jgi:hypothetical protein
MKEEGCVGWSGEAQHRLKSFAVCALSNSFEAIPCSRGLESSCEEKPSEKVTALCIYELLEKIQGEKLRCETISVHICHKN